MALEELRKRLKRSIDDALECPSSSHVTPSSSSTPSTSTPSSTFLEPLPTDSHSNIVLEPPPNAFSDKLAPVEIQPPSDSITPLEEVVQISTPQQKNPPRVCTPPRKRSVTPNDPLFDAALHFQAADYSLKNGRYAEANASYHQAFQLLRGQHVKKKEYRMLHNYADDYVTSLQLAGEPATAARFALTYGKFLMARKKYEQAELFLEEAVTIVEENELPTNGREHRSLATLKRILATNLEQQARALQDHDET